MREQIVVGRARQRHQRRLDLDKRWRRARRLRHPSELGLRREGKPADESDGGEARGGGEGKPFARLRRRAARSEDRDLFGKARGEARRESGRKRPGLAHGIADHMIGVPGIERFAALPERVDQFGGGPVLEFAVHQC